MEMRPIKDLRSASMSTLWSTTKTVKGKSFVLNKSGKTFPIFYGIEKRFAIFFYFCSSRLLGLPKFVRCHLKIIVFSQNDFFFSSPKFDFVDVSSI